MHANLLQSCLTLCDPMDCSLPGSSGHGICQARILEWVAVPSSRRTIKVIILNADDPKDMSALIKPTT